MYVYMYADICRGMCTHIHLLTNQQLDAMLAHWFEHFVHHFVVHTQYPRQGVAFSPKIGVCILSPGTIGEGQIPAGSAREKFGGLWKKFYTWKWPDQRIGYPRGGSERVASKIRDTDKRRQRRGSERKCFSVEPWEQVRVSAGVQGLKGQNQRAILLATKCWWSVLQLWYWECDEPLVLTGFVEWCCLPHMMC